MALTMGSGAGGQAEDAAQAVAEDFLAALTAGNVQEAVYYVDSETADQLITISDDEDATKAFYDNLFGNLKYEITAAGTKGNVAVVKANISNGDFSGVQQAYEDEAFKFVTSNMDSDDVKDKSKLADKCLEIYLEKIKEASENSEVKESTIYIPLISDGHNKWRVLLNDDVMKAIDGNLVLPELQK